MGAEGSNRLSESETGCLEEAITIQLPRNSLDYPLAHYNPDFLRLHNVPLVKNYGLVKLGD